MCSEVWEQKPMALPRSCHHYNDGWFSSEEMDKILREVSMFWVIIRVFISTIVCCS